MKIAILGAGDFGTALGGVLAEKGYDIDFYDTRIEKEPLSKVLDGSRYMLLCVPSKAVPYVLPHLPKNIPLIIATKGILSDVPFADFQDWMVLSGPGYAKDIKSCQPTHLTATDQRIVELFGTDYLGFDLTKDKRGVLMCGALKNVYAVLAGLMDLVPDTKEHEQFLVDVADEMQALLLANNADPNTVKMNCGVGDLRITCYYPSRNYEFGQILREHPRAHPEKTVEGVSALKRIERGEIRCPENLHYLESILERSKSWG